MMNNNCFEKLNIGISRNHPIWKDHLSYEYGHVDIQAYDKNNTFLRASLPADYLKTEPIHELMIKYNLTAKIFLIQSEWQYNWHRDAFRSMAFNLLLTEDDDYLTLFAHKYPTDKGVDIQKFIYNPITRLVYDPNTFYLLNSQIPHIAINYSKVDRYVLTIAKFEKDPLPTFYGKPANLTTYENTTDELRNMGLISDANSIIDN